MSNIYFTTAVDEAIKRYCAEQDKAKRDIIFEEHIYGPFCKLSECVFNRYGFDYVDDSPINTQLACVSHLAKVLDKYDPTIASKKFPNRKTSAFGYFSTIAKNWFIYINNKEYQRRKKYQSLDVEEEHLERTEAELHHSLQDFGPNQPDPDITEYVLSRKEEFYNLYEWALTAPNVYPSHLKVLEKVKSLLDGGVPFVPHAVHPNKPAIRHSLGSYRPVVIVRNTISKYHKYLRGKAIEAPTGFRGIRTTPKRSKRPCDYVAHRLCPSCEEIIIHKGKLGKYNCEYASRRGQKCHNCGNKGKMKHM